MPFIASTNGYFIRGDKLKEAGIDPESLTTWDARRDAALAMSDPENEFWGWGMTPNQSGDGWGGMTGILNAFGGHFTDETGTKVEFDTPETVAAFEWIAETYDRDGKYADMLPPGIESWTDSSNNEAYLAGKIGYTLNSFSIYAQAKRDDNPVFSKTLVLNAPTANNGDSRDGGQTTGWLSIFKGAPNVDLAKKLALDLLAPENFNKMSSVAGGLFNPAFADLWTDELLADGPELRDHQGPGQRARAVPRAVVAGRPQCRDRRDPGAGHLRAGDRQHAGQADDPGRGGQRRAAEDGEPVRGGRHPAGLRPGQGDPGTRGRPLKAQETSRSWSAPQTFRHGASRRDGAASA